MFAAIAYIIFVLSAVKTLKQQAETVQIVVTWVSVEWYELTRMSMKLNLQKPGIKRHQHKRLS